MKLLKHIVPAFSIIGLCIFVFILGMWINWAFSAKMPGVTRAFQAAGALYTKYTYQTEGTEPPPRNLDPVVKNNRVSWDKKAAQKGYTLVTLHTTTSAYLLDMDGKIVHKWSMPFRTAWPHPPHVPSPVPERNIGFEKAKLLPNGDLILLYTGEGDTPYGYGMAKIDKDSKLLWTYDSNTHHDFYVDQENGNIYTLAQKWQTKPLPQLGMLTYPLLADYLVTLTPDGKEFSRISMLEILRASGYGSLMLPTMDPPGWDLLHTNAVMKLEPSMAKAFPMFKPGDLLVSFRNLSALAVLDRDSKLIKWCYRGVFKGQHSPRFMKDGTIILFDNLGLLENNGFVGRIVTVDPKTNTMATKLTSNHDIPFNTSLYGRVQPLENGDMLITSPMSKRAIEVNAKGKVVWTLQMDYMIQFASRYSAKKLPFIANDVAE